MGPEAGQVSIVAKGCGLKSQVVKWRRVNKIPDEKTISADGQMPRIRLKSHSHLHQTTLLSSPFVHHLGRARWRSGIVWTLRCGSTLAASSHSSVTCCVRTDDSHPSKDKAIAPITQLNDGSCLQMSILVCLLIQLSFVRATFFSHRPYSPHLH